MRMRFEIDDEEVAHAAREELVGRFGKWLEDHPEHASAKAWDAELLLGWKFGYGDRDYGRWTRADVDEVLLEHLPRKLSASPDDAASIPRSLAALASFLDDEGLLDERSETAEAVGARALAQARSFLDAMTDPANYGMAKRLFSSVGLDDDAEPSEAALEEAMARFNDLPFEERGTILGLDDPEPDAGRAGLDLPPLPLRDMPPTADLPSLAGGVLLLVRVLAFHRALGPEGISLTKQGLPRLADARRLTKATAMPGADRVADVRSVAELPALLSLGLVATEAGAAEVDDTATPARLAPVAGWSERSVADQWQAVVDAVLDVGPATLSTGHHRMPAPLVELADDMVVHLLAMLWAVGEPVPARDFARMLREAAALEGRTARLVADCTSDQLDAYCLAAILSMFRSLFEAGVVVVEEEEDDDAVMLSRAGTRLVAPALREIGYDLVLPEDIAGLAAGDLLDALVGREGVDVDVAVRFWSAGRAAAPLAEELVAELAARPEPVRVMTGFAVLDHLGSEAVEAVRGAVDGPIAAHAWMFLASQGVVPADEVPRQLAIEAAVTMFVATAEAGSPADVVEMVLGNIPAPEHMVFVDELAGADHPRTGELLETLGRHHPDRKVAKHARKAAHRWRSTQGARAR